MMQKTLTKGRLSATMTERETKRILAATAVRRLLTCGGCNLSVNGTCNEECEKQILIFPPPHICSA